MTERRERAPRGRRRVWAAAAGAAVLLVTALVGSILLGGNRTWEPAPFPARPAPPLQGATLDGGNFDLSDWRGQVVLVNVWASWCGPCREEMPLLEDVDRRLRERGLRVVGINTSDDPRAARQFLRETGTTFPNIVDTDGSVGVGWGMIGVPETYLVDRAGQIVQKQVGPVSEEWLAATVEPLLEQQS